MIQPSAWTAVAEFLKSAWTPVGPLVGVLVGAWLARSSDRRKWMNDNRKEECRELLTAMTKVADLALEARSQRESDGGEVLALRDAWAEERKCLIVLHGRIFIAEKLKAKKVSTLWRTLTTDYLTNGDQKKFGQRLNEIKAIIIDIALNG